MNFISPVAAGAEKKTKLIVIIGECIPRERERERERVVCEHCCYSLSIIFTRRCLLLPHWFGLLTFLLTDGTVRVRWQSLGGAFTYGLYSLVLVYRYRWHWDTRWLVLWCLITPISLIADTNTNVVALIRREHLFNSLTTDQIQCRRHFQPPVSSRLFSLSCLLFCQLEPRGSVIERSRVGNVW